MSADRQHFGPVSRQGFLKGMAGVAAVAGTGNLWLSRRASITVDLSRATGKTLQPYLYGFASGALLDNDFQLAANGAVEKSARTLAPALVRFNTPVQPIISTVFAQGVAKPNWDPFANWTKHHADFLRSHGRLVFGIGPSAGDTSISPATWAEYARATALHFRAIGQEITYWEVGNECDPMGAVTYASYFNAIADALHSVNRSSLVGGPVASWWNGIDLPTFVSHSGKRIGFLDFHSYPVNDADSVHTAYHKAANFPDVQDARQKIAGTVAARLPIGLLEYNLNGGQQPNGAFGLPAQGTITGAIYVALLLSRGFTSDASFTMGGLWDLVADSNYGVIGNSRDKTSFRAIDEQGRYLSQAARLLPGQQAHSSTTTPDLQVLATRSHASFAIQLVNYSLRTKQSVTVKISGMEPGSHVGRWELSGRFPAGHATTITSLAEVSLPPESIIILTGQRAKPGGHSTDYGASARGQMVHMT